MSEERLHQGSTEPLEIQSKIGSQQLHAGNADEVYHSSDRRNVYQSSEHSFEEQRDQYAEHAINENVPPVMDQTESSDETKTHPKYDYQSMLHPEAEVSETEFGRIASATADRLIDRLAEPKQDSKPKTKKEDNNNTEKETADLSGSASDKGHDVRDKRENTDKNTDENEAHDNLKFNEKYSKLLAKKEQKLADTQKRITNIEDQKLRYSHKLLRTRLLSEAEKEKLFSKKVSDRQYEGKGKSQRIQLVTKRQMPGRLKFKTEKKSLSEKKYRKKGKKKERRFDRRTRRLKNIREDMRKDAAGSEFQEDEFTAEAAQKGKRLKREIAFGAKRNYRQLKHQYNGYSRLKFQNIRLESLAAQKTLLKHKANIDLQKQKADEISRQQIYREKNRRKIKKDMVQNYKRQQGNFFVRFRSQHRLKKAVRKERRMARKRIRLLITSITSLTVILALLLIMFLFFLALLLVIGVESFVNSTSQNTYYDMTEAAAYFRELEADLEEYIEPENLEPIILSENPEIYEFVYELDEISFDVNTLIAYLSARYNEFDLDMVRSDLEEIFEQYYTLTWEVKLEEREVPDESIPPDSNTGEYQMIIKMMPICYVKLEKSDFYELLESRIPESGSQEQMSAFYITGNGQQVYGPVMETDWRNKISSNYGWRVHPITGVRTFHDGVDIAVPTGTALYSAVKGTVISSVYSDSAGNMVTVQNDSGWQITFMHMDSRTVRTGDMIEQGQLVGYSGNTGNSTGAHLHIRVHDADGNPINPVFIIPFATIESSETF